ncbi:Uncharacterised protein [Vibrio cholerae]|nr:Uncharacterised protein [Vibrio cholerae]
MCWLTIIGNEKSAGRWRSIVSTVPGPPVETPMIASWWSSLFSTTGDLCLCSTSAGDTESCV